MCAIRQSPTETRRCKSRHVVYLVLSEWDEQYLWFVAWNEVVCESLIMDLSMEQQLAIKFCLKAGKSEMETLQMVNAAYGDQALSQSNVSDSMDDFVMDEKTFQMIPGVAGLQSVAMTTMSRRFLKCCFKTVTFH